MNSSTFNYKLKTPLVVLCFSLLFIFFVVILLIKYAWIINFYNYLELVILFTAILLFYPLLLIARYFFVRELFIGEEGVFLAGKKIFSWADLDGCYFAGEHFFLHINFRKGRKNFKFWFLEFAGLEKFKHFTSGVNCFKKISFMPKKYSKKGYWFLPFFALFFLAIFVYVQIYLNELTWPDEVILLLILPSLLFVAAMLAVWLKKIPDDQADERVRNYLNNNQYHQSIAVFYALIFSLSFTLMIFIYQLLKGSLKKNISQGPFFIYSLVFLFLIFYFKRTYCINKIKYFLKLIHRAEVFSGVFVLATLFYITLSFSLGAINVKWDRKELKKANSHLVLKKIFKYNKKIIKCFILKDWTTNRDLSFRHCVGAEPYDNDEKVEVFYGNGFLNVIWIEKIRPIWANDFNNYVQRMGGIDKLVYFDFLTFSFLNPDYNYSDLIKEFETKCIHREMFYCRYQAYIFDILKDEQKAFELYKKNCNQKDFLSCMNMVRIIHRDNNYRTNEEIVVIEGFLMTLCGSPKTSIEMRECEMYKSWKRNQL